MYRTVTQRNFRNFAMMQIFFDHIPKHGSIGSFVIAGMKYQNIGFSLWIWCKIHKLCYQTLSRCLICARIVQILLHCLNIEILQGTCAFHHTSARKSTAAGIGCKHQFSRNGLSIQFTFSIHQNGTYTTFQHIWMQTHMLQIAEIFQIDAGNTQGNSKKQSFPFQGMKILQSTNDSAII